MNLSETINKLPVLIVSSPRTGSTPLLHYVQKCCGEDIPFFMEPTTGNWQPGKKDWSTGKVMEEFIATARNSKRFIVKDHIHTLHKHDPSILKSLLSESTYKIRLQRRDTIKQVASRYIVWHRNLWHHDINTKEADQQEDIPLHSDVVLTIHGYINAINKMLIDSNIEFDLDVFYEDLVFEGIGFISTPKPRNYNELLEFITYQTKHVWPYQSKYHIRL